MLDPQDRVLFTEALRPPEGHELSWAIGTSYTLDLVAAMAAPLAMQKKTMGQMSGRSLTPASRAVSARVNWK